MKIGVSSYSFSHYMRDTGANYCQIADLAKEIGFEGMDFTDLLLDVQPADSIEALAHIVRDHCDELGLPIASYTVSADFLQNDDMVEQLYRKIDICEILGAKVLRHDISWRRDVPWRDMIALTADKVRKVTEYAQAKGIRTCTENHGFVLQDADRLETLIQTVNHPNYGWLVDCGNFLCADESPVHALPIAAPYAFHAHAKDFIFKTEAPGEGWITTRNGNAIRGTIVGHGVVPLPYCVKTLRDNGYDGWLALEFEGFEENLLALRQGCAYLKKITAE